MESFNKIVSFVLGLIVVIVFLAIITGRFNIGRNFKNLSSRMTVTPTPTIQPPVETITGKSYFASTTSTPAPSLTMAPTSKPLAKAITQVTKVPTATPRTVKKPTVIPSTGSPTLLLPILFSLLPAGFYLKKKS